MRTSALRFGLGLAALGFCSPAFGAEPREPSPGSVAAEDGDARARALELFQLSETRYRERAFRGAADLLERAYAIYPEPVLLYNLARAHEGLGDPSRAAETYERYLAADPSVSDRAALERRIAELRERARSLAAAQASKPSPAPKTEPSLGPGRARPALPSPPHQAEASRDWFPWLVAGGGIATLGAGLVLGGLAHARHQAAVDDRDATSAEGTQNQAQDLAVASTITVLTGAVVAGAGATWGLVRLFGAPEPRAPQAGATLLVTPFAVRIAVRL